MWPLMAVSPSMGCSFSPAARNRAATCSVTSAEGGDAGSTGAALPGATVTCTEAVSWR